MSRKKTADLTADEIREVAMGALHAVAGDKMAPAAARASAARTMLEAIGTIGRNQDLSRNAEDRNATEMTPGEIADEILRLSKKLPKARAVKVA